MRMPPPYILYAECQADVMLPLDSRRHKGVCRRKMVREREGLSCAIKSFAAVAVAAGVLSVAAGSLDASATADSRAQLAAAPTVSLRSTKLGKILVNSHGLTLYLWVKDKHGKSVCSAACASLWPLLLISGKPTAGRGVKASKLGEYKTSSGKYEVTLTAPGDPGSAALGFVAVPFEPLAGGSVARLHT